jgi:hypothetical protein
MSLMEIIVCVKFQGYHVYYIIKDENMLGYVIKAMG